MGGVNGARRKLLLLVPNLNGGGAERVMIHLLRHIDRDRYDLTFGLGHASGHFLHDVPRDVATIVFGHARSYQTIPALARELRLGRFDLVYSMTAMNVAVVLARALARVHVPIVLGARNHYSACLPMEASYPSLRIRAIRALYPRAELVIGVSQGVCDDLVENFGIRHARALAISNPLDLTRITASAEETPVDPWLDGQRDVPVILSVAKLMAAKGHFDLLTAFREVRVRRPARLLLLGQGPLESEIRTRIEAYGLREDVRLVGFAANPYKYMARADVFVLSSHWEGFPNVLAEAMACGTAVVSTDCPSGPSEIVEHERTGLLVPVGAPGELAHAIASLLDDDERRREFAVRAKKSSERYRATEIVSQYEAAFERVMLLSRTAAPANR